MLWPPVFGWACRALGEGDVRAVFDVGRAYTQNGRYNHKYHFFIGTTLNGGIWQSKFQCKTPTPSGQTVGCAKQTAARPHYERRGRTWYQVILGIVKILGTWTPLRMCDNLASQRAEGCSAIARNPSSPNRPISRYVTLWQIVAIPANGAKMLELELQMSPLRQVMLNARSTGRDQKHQRKQDRQKRRERTETIAWNYRRHCAIVASRRIPHPSPSCGYTCHGPQEGAVVTINAFSWLFPRSTAHPHPEALHTHAWKPCTFLNFSGSIHHLWGAVSKWVFISFPPFLFCLLNYSALFYFILFPPWSIFLYRPSGIMSQELKFNLVFKFASPRIDFAARRRTFSGIGFKNEIYGQLFKKYMFFVWNFWFTSN